MERRRKFHRETDVANWCVSAGEMHSTHAADLFVVVWSHFAKICEKIFFTFSFAVTLSFNALNSNLLFQLRVSMGHISAKCEVSTAFRFRVNRRRSTDRQTDGRTDGVQRFMRPLRTEGCIITFSNTRV